MYVFQVVEEESAVLDSCSTGYLVAWADFECCRLCIRLNWYVSFANGETPSMASFPPGHGGRDREWEFVLSL